MNHLNPSPLASLRRAAKLSQEELGRLTATDGETQFHQPRISSYENGRKAMPITTAKRIVRVLNRRLKKLGSKRVAKIEDMVHPSRR